MAIKLSHSSINTYLTCPQMYKLQYMDKLSPITESSALKFGKAMDSALNEVLEDKKNNVSCDLNKAINKFNEQWEQQEDKYQGVIDLPKNINIEYSKYDFDKDLLTKEDIDELNNELDSYKKNLSKKEKSAFPFDYALDFFSYLRDKISEVEFSGLTDSEKSFHNLVMWMCLKNKAPILIEAYVTQLLPKIDKVLDVQTALSVKEGDDELTGISDFICTLVPGVYGKTEVKKGEVLIPDNKTASMKYEDDSVETSPQLAKYSVMLNDKGYNITKGAYFVILKKLSKSTKKTCKSCGNIALGTHKTCNALVNDARCNGEWYSEVSFSGETQLVVQEIPQNMKNMSMENVDFVMKGIQHEVFPRNFSACNNQFGKACKFKKFCHSNCMDGLIKRDKK